ncbi:MAG: hypothetical protein ACYS9X_11875 [Planctomycetota bacterium]|jgi:hypothetical protein
MHQEARFINSYFDGFLHGVANSGGMVPIHDDPGNAFQAGFYEGLALHASLADNERQPLSLLDFAHAQVEATGQYSVGFEASWFQPDGRDEKWWVAFTRDVDGYGPSSGRYRFVGHLSPDSSYGHLVGCHNRLIVHEIQTLQDVPQPKRPAESARHRDDRE